MRRLPPVTTAVVLLAVGVMMALGIWQLQRLQWKEGLIARYAAAQNDTRILSVERIGNGETLAYRHVAIDCKVVTGWQVLSGRNAGGVAGWAQDARCGTDAGGAAPADVVIGWSRDPQRTQWRGGAVTGIVVPGGELGAHLVADPPLAGLQANARPDPADTPNNHLAYAVQWFLFAATALVIYALALHRRWRERG